MSLKIIREVEWDEEIRYTLDFLERDNTSCGYSFPCDKYGIVDPNIPVEAKENYRKCVDAGNMMIHEGIKERLVDFKIPALAECECGNQFELDGDTVCHKCRREYNGSGQLLACRELWGEETGEKF